MSTGSIYQPTGSPRAAHGQPARAAGSAHQLVTQWPKSLAFLAIAPPAFLAAWIAALPMFLAFSIVFLIDSKVCLIFSPHSKPSLSLRNPVWSK
jgi:hypothetical protein